MNYKKLLNSKWTSIAPVNKEKHFQVVKVLKNHDDPQIIDSITLEAVMTKRLVKLIPSDLKNQQVWLQGWK